MDRRRFLAASAAVPVGLAGCAGNDDSNDNESADDGGGSGDARFDESATDSLLSASALDGWEQRQVRETDRDASGLVAGRVIELQATDRAADLQLGVAVFESADDASSFLDVQATEYRDQFEATVDAEDGLGDEAQTVRFESGAAVETRLANLVVQVIGAESPDGLRAIAQQQLDAVTG